LHWNFYQLLLADRYSHKSDWQTGTEARQIDMIKTRMKSTFLAESKRNVHT